MKVRVFLLTAAIGLFAWMTASYFHDLPENGYSFQTVTPAVSEVALAEEEPVAAIAE